MSSMRSSTPGAMVMLVAAAIGLAIALYAYLTPLTGVTGTLGALIVMITCATIAVLALGLARSDAGALRTLVRIISLLVIVGTAFAALLLHLWWLAIAMVVALVGWIIDIVRPAPAQRTSS